MATFRDLLRNEIDFRLKILGPDWAPTMKQESNLRLEAYKKWLWALHNGVGSDPIVPPSRYERARRTGERRAREKQQDLVGYKENVDVDDESLPPRQRRPRKRNS